MVKELAINSQIQAREVMVIGAQGERLGVMPLARALQLAKEQALDLVEVSAQQTPPVCKILEYSKYKFDLGKKEKARRSQRVGLLREVRLRPKIKDHDLESKARLVQRLLEEGNKVKVSVVFRGREATHPELGWKVLQGLGRYLTQTALVEKAPALEESGNLQVVFTPAKKGKDAQDKNP